jgi:hypothetical protein
VLHYCNNEDEDMHFLFLEMLQVALGPQWWRSERLLSSGDSLPRKPSACLRAAKTTLGFFDHRMRCVLLSAANQGGKESLSSTASSTRSTHCVATLQFAAEWRKRSEGGGWRERLDSSIFCPEPCRTGPTLFTVPTRAEK